MDRRIINKILKAIDINKGQIVLLQFWGEDSQRDILHNFSFEVLSLGASPIEFQQSRLVNYEMFTNASDTCFNDKYYALFDNVDIVIDICMYKAVLPLPKLSENKEKMDIYRKYMSKLFSTLSKKEKFVQIRIPSEENAIESGLESNIFIEKMNKAYDIDYDDLKKRCEEKVMELEGKSNAVIKTGANCELSLCLEERKWCIDAGDGDLPCGEIAVAPIEEKTNGTVYFEKIFIDTDVTADNVILTIENGKIIKSDSDIFNEFLNELPPNGDIICELGIGMNENVEELTGYTVLDEKMAGTFHLGIGMNTLFGGKNDCPMHIDFVGVGELLFL